MRSRLRTYLTVVATIGLALLAFLATTVDVDRVRADLPVFVILSVFALAGSFFSVPLSRDGRGPAVLVGAPFAFALVLFGGVGAAALVHAASLAVYHLAHRKPAWKAAFNVGAHTIGLAAGAGVWMALDGGGPVSSDALPAILAGTLVYMAVKNVLVLVPMSRDQTVQPQLGLARLLRNLVGRTVMALAVVLVIVLATEHTTLLLALGLLLSAAAHLMLRGEARANIGRTEAEQTARREAELRMQEHELRLQQQEVARTLRETDKMKDDLLAMVSHELRTPLTTVVGTLRLLSTGAPLSGDERQELLEMADRQARRLRSLIEQLLLAAQSEREAGYPAGTNELVEADAAALLGQAATEARAGSCKHPIRVEGDGRLPVRLAPDAILQILGNLIDNACKYSPDGSMVWLAAERDGADAVLAVEDDGAGVPPAERERVFERFTRLGAGRGLGLGLYIARELARAQGGDLVLAGARHAGGARFELRLPLREPATPPVTSGRWSPTT